MRHKHLLSRQQLRTLDALASCRTSALGGHVDQCRKCGKEHISYNSCRNRHCPKCGGLHRLNWQKNRNQSCCRCLKQPGKPCVSFPTRHCMAIRECSCNNTCADSHGLLRLAWRMPVGHGRSTSQQWAARENRHTNTIPNTMNAQHQEATDWPEWFRYQLRASGDGFVWSMRQLSIDRHNLLPPRPGYLGTWPAVRHLWHVTEYERMLTIPSMKQWLGGPKPDNDSWDDSDGAWERVPDKTANHLVEQFQAVRHDQIEMLGQLQVDIWDENLDTLWGQKPLSMVVTKTFQHTYEHSDTVLRMGMWWDRFASEAPR